MPAWVMALAATGARLEDRLEAWQASARGSGGTGQAGDVLQHLDLELLEALFRGASGQVSAEVETDGKGSNAG